MQQKAIARQKTIAFFEEPLYNIKRDKNIRQIWRQDV
jgi:hypothetical protein